MRKLARSAQCGRVLTHTRTQSTPLGGSWKVQTSLFINIAKRHDTPAACHGKWKLQTSERSINVFLPLGVDTRVHPRKPICFHTANIKLVPSIWAHLIAMVLKVLTQGPKASRNAKHTPHS